jgi:hypothetical protein
VDAGDDEADIEPLSGGFDAGTDTALLIPGLGLIAGLGEAAQGGFLFERTAGADVVGDFVDQAVEDDVAGQSEDEANAVFFAPRHHLLATVMAIAANGDVRLRPVFADAADEAAQMAAHLLARGCLAGPQ